MTNEEFYDAEIAPVLLELSKKLEDRGMPFLAAVEYEKGERGITKIIPEDAGLAMIMLGHCAKTAENIDGYVLGLIKYCRENNIDTDASMVLSKLAH